MRKGLVLTLVSLFAVACLSVAAFAADKGGLSMSEKAFMKDAASDGMMEVQLGQLAQQKASSQAVKDFGKRMETDHQKANDELKSVAEKTNMQLPTQLERKHKSMIDKVSNLSGDEFDKKYMKEMVKEHKKDVSKFTKMSKKAKDPGLKQWVDTTLPTLQQHLDLAKQTAQQVGVEVKHDKQDKQEKQQK